MAFRRSDLQEAFFVPGTQPSPARLAATANHQDRAALQGDHRVRPWKPAAGAARAYGTSDPLEEVLAPGSFEHARGLLRPGELIYVSACPGAPRGSGADHGAARMALVIARADERDAERALGSVRGWLLGPTTEVGPVQRATKGRAAVQGDHRGRPWEPAAGAARVQDFGGRLSTFG